MYHFRQQTAYTAHTHIHEKQDSKRATTKNRRNEENKFPRINLPLASDTTNIKAVVYLSFNPYQWLKQIELFRPTRCSRVFFRIAKRWKCPNHHPNWWPIKMKSRKKTLIGQENFVHFISEHFFFHSQQIKNEEHKNTITQSFFLHPWDAWAAFVTVPQWEWKRELYKSVQNATFRYS